MPEGFLELNNQITALTNEVFENKFELYANANKNNKIFIVLDHNGNIKQVYERLKNISLAVHDFESTVFHIKSQKEINGDIWKVIGYGAVTDVIIIFDDNSMLPEIVSSLHTRIKNMVDTEGTPAFNFVRLVFFRMFQKKSVSSPTDYFRNEMKALAGTLCSSFSMDNDYERSLWFPGTRIYSYLMSDENDIDIECFQFADKIYKIICDDDFVKYATTDTQKFKKDDCPWYTFKIRQMYIPEWILISSLSQKVREVFFTDSANFAEFNQSEVNKAKSEIQKLLHIKVWKELDSEVKEYIRFVPLEITEQEYEDISEKQKICKRNAIKLFGMTLREAEYGYSEKKCYKETPLNDNESFFMEKYMTWIDKMLPEDKFCQIIFDSMEHFINIANDSDYELIRNKIRTIIDKVFEEDDKNKSVILNKLIEKYKAVLNDEVFKEYCEKARKSINRVDHTLQNNKRAYERHINGLDADKNPNNIFTKLDLRINSLTDESSIYRQLISYLEQNKENFKNIWKDETDTIKSNFSLRTARVFLPLVSQKQQSDTKPFSLSEFEKKIKRDSQIYFVKCDSINELSFGIFDPIVKNKEEGNHEQKN